jgi:hypothetical protein
MVMVETDPDPAVQTLYVCRECGTGFEGVEWEPAVRRVVANSGTTVAHD